MVDVFSTITHWIIYCSQSFRNEFIIISDTTYSIYPSFISHMLHHYFHPYGVISPSRFPSSELCHISLEVKGYDFSLLVRSEAEIPSELKLTQENVTELSRAAKSVISVSTKLNEMIDSLLRDEDSMISQIQDAESRHQEQKRLMDNLRENLREARRATELSPKYRKEAGNLLNEAALLSGITP